MSADDDLAQACAVGFDAAAAMLISVRP